MTEVVPNQVARKKTRTVVYLDKHGLVKLLVSFNLGSRRGEEWSLETVEALCWNLLPLKQGSFPTPFFFSDHNHKYAKVHSRLRNYHTLRL